MVSNLFNIEGKRILITGSTRGLGNFLARALGETGAVILLNGTREVSVEKAANELRELDIKCYASAFDISNNQEVESRLPELIEEAGGIDVLINNAGIQIRHPLEEFPAEDWKKIIDINLTGTFLVSKTVVKTMINQGYGKIINICSVQSELGRPTITPYAATKGGIKMMTKGMATEWGKHNIQVNGIGPGYFDTEMTRPLVEDEQFNSWLCSRTPANRWGLPSELVGAAIFLSSEASSYVNGHILYVDGGMLSCV